MSWQTPMPGMPDDGPPLVGSRWTRTAPAGDDWDYVEVRGIHDVGRDNGLPELVVTPVSFGPVMTADFESFLEHYQRDGGDDADPLRRVTATLQRLQAMLP